MTMSKKNDAPKTDLSFRPGSMRGRFADLMADGIARTSEDIVKELKATIGDWAKGSARTYVWDLVIVLRKLGIEIVEPEHGTFQMIVKAPAKAAPKRKRNRKPSKKTAETT